MANGTMAGTRTIPLKAKTTPSPKKQSSSAGTRNKVSPTPIPRTATPRQNLVNIFDVLKNNSQPMQISQQGVPYKVLVGNPNEDPGYLRPPTQQDIDYGKRLDVAQEQKASRRFLTGMRDPVAVEQRITAAERQNPYWEGKLRSGGPIKEGLSNVGDMLKSTFSNTLGRMVPFAFLPGGSIYKAGWGHDPSRSYDVEGAARSAVFGGEGTSYDQRIRGQRAKDLYKHKYYGQPDPGPRPSNVYDELGMPQPKPRTPMMDYGQNDIPLYLRDAGACIDREFGPAKVPPPGSDRGSAGSQALHGMFPNQYFGGMPGRQPKSSFDLSGGRGKKEEEGKKKETFNILKFLMGLIGLPFKLLGLVPPGEEEENTEKPGRPYQPQRQQIPRQTYTPAHKSGGQKQ